MAFTHGRNTRVLVDGIDLSIYLRTANASDSFETVDTTTFASTAKSWLVGFAEGRLSVEGLLDGGVGAVDEILHAALGGSGQVITVFRDGYGTVGGRAEIMSGRESTYNKSSAVNDAVAISAEFVADGGINAAVVLHEQVAQTVTGNGTAVDNLAATSNGAVAHLQVTAISGTTPSITVAVQDSADGATGWAAIGTFTARTTVGAQRIAIAGAVRRYTRASWTISGGTPSMTFSVALARL